MLSEKGAFSGFRKMKMSANQRSLIWPLMISPNSELGLLFHYHATAGRVD